MNPNVTLTTTTVTKRSGRQYTYWQLRWYGPTGRRYCKSIGRVGELSKRQAQKLRQDKERELAMHPIRRDSSRVPTLGQFLGTYLESRRAEIAARTHELHEQTARYLRAYFTEHRRIDEIKRYHAREFKTDLGNGKLKHINERQYASMQPSTVDLHMRNARTIFNRAVDDDLIEVNPFDRLTGGVAPKDKNWRYISFAEFEQLISACPSDAWRALLGLCRLAGLRQGEALGLTWGDVAWDRSRLSVWATKTKRRRIVPIAPELLPILRDTQPESADSADSVIQGLVTQNLWRDFRVICKRAGIEHYAKWCHTLRKNRESDWIASGFPLHVVVEWMGHSDEVARQHYLRVDESNLVAASRTGIGAQPEAEETETVQTQLWTQPEPSEPETAEDDEPQIINLEEFKKKAGDGIRTHDVQLGKLAFYH